jgi:mono/diheme cytochrome c family protein
VVALAASIACTAAGCRRQQSLATPDPGLERMLAQPRVDPYAPSPFFADGRAMRRPPEGSLAVEDAIDDPIVRDGRDEAGHFATRVPIAFDRELLTLGRHRFETICATCHGILGDGVSVVAASMELRRPPSLHVARIRALPDGRIYQVILTGYGLMPSYAALLGVRDRWAVVAYLRALQLARRADVARLPDDLQRILATKGLDAGGAP